MATKTQPRVAPPRPPQPEPRPGLNVRALLIGCAVLLAVVVFAIVRGSTSGQSGTAQTVDQNRARAGQPTGSTSASSASNSSSSGGAGPDGPVNTVAGQSYFPGPNDPLPDDISISQTTNLTDGDPITIHIAAKQATPLYGFDARLCMADQQYAADADLHPTQLGKCISQPLSASSDAFVEKAADAPFQVVDGTFRVGEGTDTYSTQDGRRISITCGHDHPCALVVKVQFQNGYGFRSYPLQYK